MNIEEHATKWADQRTRDTPYAAPSWDWLRTLLGEAYLAGSYQELRSLLGEVTIMRRFIIECANTDVYGNEITAGDIFRLVMNMDDANGTVQLADVTVKEIKNGDGHRG